MKMACGDKKAACAVAILDPDLTVSMPPTVTATTGIDAVSHAVETYVTKPRNAVSQLFSRRAWGLLAGSFRNVLCDPDNIDARGNMLLGAHFAGAAIENSMLGATHSLANPLSAHFDMVHGTAIGIMLPHVIRFNAALVASAYADLAFEAGLCDRDDPDAPEHLARFVAALVEASGGPTSLEAAGVRDELIPQLAREAAAQWTARFNPRPVTADDFQEIYSCAFSKDSALP
jgi:alcohol dehydrogenase